MKGQGITFMDFDLSLVRSERMRAVVPARLPQTRFLVQPEPDGAEAVRSGRPASPDEFDAAGTLSGELAAP